MGRVISAVTAERGVSVAAGWHDGGMANSRRSRRTQRAHLALVPGTGQEKDSGAGGKTRRGGGTGQGSGSGRGGDAPPGAALGPAEVSPADLRELMAAAGAPDEVLAAVESAADMQALLAGLEEGSMLPSSSELLDGLLDGWKPLLEPGCDPLSAELTGTDFVALVRQIAPEETDVPELLAAMIEQATDSGTREALAMLRALAVTAPAQVRPAAVRAADQLAAGGLTDLPWVGGLGSPKPGKAFGYGDPETGQQAIAVTFSYGRKRHAVAALIDHDLGGGVKDCFVTDRPNMIRSAYESSARTGGMEFAEYAPGEARAILEAALSCPPCPADPDQIADVSAYLDLLSARTALLAGGALPRVGTRADGGRGRQSGSATVHRLKITLSGLRPPIWRRLEVPSDITLARLHDAIQAVFGWEGCHLWVFSTPSGQYGMRDAELGFYSAAAKKLSAAAPERGDRISYTYDFGDDWEHDIRVEAVVPAGPGTTYPRCTAGRRACPPEDCGGVWGYADLLEVLADPRHEDHAERLEWLGLESAAEFDPDEFGLAEVNDALSYLARLPR